MRGGGGWRLSRVRYKQWAENKATHLFSFVFGHRVFRTWQTTASSSAHLSSTTSETSLFKPILIYTTKKKTVSKWTTPQVKLTPFWIRRFLYQKSLTTQWRRRAHVGIKTQKVLFSQRRCWREHVWCKQRVSNCEMCLVSVHFVASSFIISLRL